MLDDINGSKNIITMQCSVLHRRNRLVDQRQISNLVQVDSIVAD